MDPDTLVVLQLPKDAQHLVELVHVHTDPQFHLITSFPSHPVRHPRTPRSSCTHRNERPPFSASCSAPPSWYAPSPPTPLWPPPPWLRSESSATPTAGPRAGSKPQGSYSKGAG